MGVSTWGLSYRHSVIFQNPAGASPPPVQETYVTEDGLQDYTTEDGTEKYVTES